MNGGFEDGIDLDKELFGDAGGLSMVEIQLSGFLDSWTLGGGGGYHE